MRNAGLPALLLVLVVTVIGAVFYFYRHPLRRMFLRPQRPIAAQGAEAARPKPGKRLKAERKATEAADSVEDTPRMETPLLSPSTPQLRHPFPTRGDLARGMERATLWRSFCEPDLRITSIERGRLLERYIYVSAEQNATTYAFLEEAKVVAAYTAFR